LENPAGLFANRSGWVSVPFIRFVTQTTPSLAIFQNN
jgi:hypothetical protein